jgi:hypothetical protein
MKFVYADAESSDSNTEIVIEKKGVCIFCSDLLSEIYKSM